ncbi:uncharacterized protein EI90DRAFT_2948972 [Cantharellus anzutake]|uniref:uncharacterized protein n=1 Tax=Cantharellus anzutake TaxID=1750568 RepID=UPI001907A2BD|nr:uncharacterized protein EI90DRAFT_2948972 [Cantharellus anzutake]KAF8313898.1 hypothetical protein EI90DRAFT_2948972 [Cantharellus anzutake]
MGSGDKKVIKRRQITLDGAYAFTDYRAQGQTIEYLWVDIGTPLRGSLTPFNAYVTLSRARGRANVRLVRDFKDSLFTKIPCELLEKEDERLIGMSKKNKREWTKQKQTR